MVFGTGFVEPGGTQAVLESIGALGLDGTTNFLDIGASLCGSARAITTSFGAYVTAMDLDADLVAAGLSQIRDVHLDKKVDVSILDLEHSGFRENRNAGTMIRNTLTYYYDKLALIDACAVSIKPGGQLLIEDRFLSYQSDTAPFEQWHAGEGVEIFPTDLEKLGRDLVELGLAVRSTNDITMAYMSSLLGAWGGVGLVWADGPLQGRILSRRQGRAGEGGNAPHGTMSRNPTSGAFPWQYPRLRRLRPSIFPACLLGSSRRPPGCSHCVARSFVPSRAPRRPRRSAGA